MTTAQWAVLAAAAVLVLWMVGAYNRLVDLRNRIGAAWGEVDAARAARAEAVAPMLTALREPLAAELGALDGFVAAHQQATEAAAAFTATPVSAAAAAAWVRAEATLAAAASRLLALAEQWSGAAADSSFVAALALWRDAQARISFARRAFDQTAAAYNAAASQAPTRWLLRWFGFGPAGLLG